MVAELAPNIPPERGWRGPGCDERCVVVKALVPGVFGRSELLLHDPDVHEEYGRLMGGSVIRNQVFDTGRLTIDLARLIVAMDGQPIHVPATELRLLLVLARRAGVTVVRDEVLSLVWGDGVFSMRPKDRNHVLNVTVCRLRRRLHRAGDLVVRVAGIGLRLDLLPAGTDGPSAAGRSLLNGRWALDWEACRRCERTDRDHNGHGYCTTCHKVAMAQGLEPYGRERGTS